MYCTIVTSFRDLVYIYIYIYIIYFVFFFLEDINYSHCIHNWPVTREISNVFKFRRVGFAYWWHDTLRTLLRIARPAFLPNLTPGQFNGVRRSVEVTSKFRLSHFPCLGCLLSWQPPRSPPLPHNLVSRVATIGMQWEYYAILVTLKYEVK